MLLSKKGFCQKIKKDSIPNGFVFSFGGGGQQPIGTLNNRFTVGGCLNFKGLYRTKTNFFVGLEAEQMFGHRVKDTFYYLLYEMIMVYLLTIMVYQQQLLLRVQDLI